MKKLKSIQFCLKESLRTREIKKTEAAFIGVEFANRVLPKSIGLPSKQYNGYEPCPPYLKKVLTWLNIPYGSSVIDVGAGKGFAMFLMGHFCFKRVDGIEISEQLAQIAEHNLACIWADMSRFRLFCCNAINFSQWEQYDYIFMFNPFKEQIMKSVISAIAESLIVAPRTLTIIYMNPVYSTVIDATGLFPYSNRYRNCMIFSTHPIRKHTIGFLHRCYL